jgi:hypothetical protein
MEKKNFEFSASYTSITKYIDQERDNFIPQLYGKVRTLDYVTIVPDVPYSKEIGPLVSSTLDFVAGDCSVFANTGTTSVATVNVTTCLKKTGEQFCLDEMKQYFANNMPRGASQEGPLPFEEAFMNEKYSLIAKKLDALFFLGDSCVTGIIPGATAGGATVIGTASVTATPWTVSTTVNNGAILTIDTMIDSLSDDYRDAEDLVLFVNRKAFDAYTRSIRNLNLFHYNPEEIKDGSVSVFGKYNVRLVATAGLTGTNKAILHRGSLLFWATDLNPLEEPINGGFERTLDKYVIVYKVKIGTGVGFPAQAVVLNVA